MHTDFLKSPAVNILADRIIVDRRESPRLPFMLAAWIWRAEDPDEPIAIRLLDHSERGVGFVCPFPLDTGEHFDLCLERDGVRHAGLRVTYCEFYGEDTFRIGAQVVTRGSSNGPGELT